MTPGGYRPRGHRASANGAGRTRRSRSPWPPARPTHHCGERPGPRPHGTPSETVSARSTSFQRRLSSPQIKCHPPVQQTPGCRSTNGIVSQVSVSTVERRRVAWVTPDNSRTLGPPRADMSYAGGSPISSAQVSGYRRLKSSINPTHSLLSRILNSTPRERSQSSSPGKLLDSPTTSRGIPN